MKANKGGLATVQVLSTMQMRKVVNTLTFKGSMLPSPRKIQADRERNLLGRLPHIGEGQVDLAQANGVTVDGRASL